MAEKKVFTSTTWSEFVANMKTLITKINNKADKSHTHNYAGSSSAGGSANSVANSMTVQFNSGTTEGTNKFTFNGSAAKSINITPAGIGAATSGHTHNYAGSSSTGGAATSANKINTDAGSATQPVYFSNGVPVKTTYTLGASVPSGAKFTDTVYTHPSYTARTGSPSANQTPSFGGTATVTQITSDSSGHVTAATDRTITIPGTLSNGTGTAGLIKTTSTVTSNSGYTPCPVISGVPYYKDTNTTYSLGSFSVTATASELNVLDGITASTTELNYCDGVTSNIQTQLNSKLNSSSVVSTVSANSASSVPNNTGVINYVNDIASAKMDKADASGTGSFSINRLSGTTSGVYSMVLGYDSSATADFTVAIGNESAVNSNYGIALGHNSSILNTYGIGIGNGIQVNTSYQVAVGKYNLVSGTSYDSLFVIGNGTSNSSRSNVFAVDNSGNIYVNNSELETAFTSLVNL